MIEPREALAYAILALFAVYMLRRCQPSLAPLISALATLGLAAMGIGMLKEAEGTIGEAFLRLGGGEVAEDVMRMLGVGYTFGLCSDLCRELGEGGLADGVLTLGRVEILLLSLPTVRRILELGMEIG